MLNTYDVRSTSFLIPSKYTTFRRALSHSCTASFHDLCSFQTQFNQCRLFGCPGYVHLSAP